MKNAISWFEIPVAELDRAEKFYSEVFQVTLQPYDMGTPTHKMRMFPSDPEGVGGALMWGEGYVPSKDGVLVYLSGGEDLLGPLSRVESAGGAVIQPKTGIGENGFFALFEDTEGNRIALHSPH